MGYSTLARRSQFLMSRDLQLMANSAIRNLVQVLRPDLSAGLKDD